MATEELTTEQWRAVPGYEGFYEVSDAGRVRSLDRIKSNGRRSNGRILSTPLSAGYPCLNLCRSGSQVLVRVHRLVAEAFLGPAPDPSETVNHKDFDRTNNRAENLEWLSHADNMRHAHAANRCRREYATGERHACSKLSRLDVLDIRKRAESGASDAELAREFGVTATNVWMIRHRKSWRSV